MVLGIEPKDLYILGSTTVLSPQHLLISCLCKSMFYAVYLMLRLNEKAFLFITEKLAMKREKAKIMQ